MFTSHFSPAQGTQLLTRLSLAPALLSGLFFALFLVSAAWAGPLDLPMYTPIEVLLAQRAISEPDTARATNPPMAPYDSLRPPPEEATARKKSEGKAFVYNLLIPGTGHLYAGYKRGWVNIGIEGLTWLTYFYYQDLGHQKENEYEAYADGHWDYDKWIAECGCQGSPEDSLIREFYVNNKQQYYEDIGKISTYWGGWDDYSTTNNSSQNKDFYRGIRADSNNFFKNAHYAVLVAFVNRVVSAVDVLRLMKKHGKPLNLGSDTKLFIRMHTKPFSSDNGVGLELQKSL